MKETKPYKLPERYSLEISNKDPRKFRIKDLERNVLSKELSDYWSVPSYIHLYELNLKKVRDMVDTNDNIDIDLIIRPASKYKLFYKGKLIGKHATIPGLLEAIKSIISFNSKISALNNREEVSL